MNLLLVVSSVVVVVVLLVVVVVVVVVVDVVVLVEDLDVEVIVVCNALGFALFLHLDIKLPL